jgi:hypothetical protein
MACAFVQLDYSPDEVYRVLTDPKAIDVFRSIKVECRCIFFRALVENPLLPTPQSTQTKLKLLHNEASGSGI